MPWQIMAVTKKALAEEGPTAAKAAGLRYVSDDMPGIRRKNRGRGFEYFLPEGKRLRDAEELARISSLAVPPAWTDVWISPVDNGHLQATGRDVRGRKQYRYHDAWRAARDENKFDRMIEFGDALSGIRGRVVRDLKLPGLPRERVLATIVRLLDSTYARVGNLEYAKENGSYGLTTLRDKHVRFDGGTIRFKFRGKGGKEHEIGVDDPRLARIVKRCRDLPGYELFQYVGDDGEQHAVGSTDVNDYLRESTGQDFTAKDFRTWAGTLLTLRALKELGPPRSRTIAVRNVNTAIKAVAGILGNTAAVCKKCYVHPAVMDRYMDGSLTRGMARRVPRGLRRDEADLLVLLRAIRREAAGKSRVKRRSA